MREFINSQIAAKRALLEQLERNKLTVQAELRTYQEMLAHLDPPCEQKSNGSDTPLGRGMIPSEMTSGWLKILCKIDELGRSFGAADIVLAGDMVGVPTKMPNARGQIYQWEKKHIITRVRKGKYKLAQKGLETVRKVEGSDAGTSEPSES